LFCTSLTSVIAIEEAGIKALPTIINACLVTAAGSAATADLYTSSRAIYGIALNGDLPKASFDTNLSREEIST